MKITKLELKNFKRFDDLTIDMTSLAEPPKLVLLIGTNGSGKSSVFDGFEALNTISKSTSGASIGSYYIKDNKKDCEIIATTDIKLPSGEAHQSKIISNQTAVPAKHDSFYGRTSIRQVSRLARTSLVQASISFEKDSDRPKTFIDRDNRFENDIEKVASAILTEVFKGNSSTREIIEHYIDPINKSFIKIFGASDGTGVELRSIKPPLDSRPAEIIFKKGVSEIPYDYLSSGEKEIFNILLNLLTRREFFQDTVYFLDEIDLHLNTQLQKNLLKEITENWIPDNCQLWTASHSLGFIEYANEAKHATIIDLDNLNFDIPQVIFPSPKNTSDIFEIAVSKEFLSKLLDGKKIIFSENTDTPLYNNLNIKDTVFFNGKDKADVFYKVKNNAEYHGLIDRDYLTDHERGEIVTAYPSLFILGYYSIENYLYHPDNLDEFFNTRGLAFDKKQYQEAIIKEKTVARDRILLGVLRARESYPFFRDAKPKIERDKEEEILKMFDSEDLETFYKVFPAKDYGTEIKERQHINPADLAKTNWFKAKIEEVLQK